VGALKGRSRRPPRVEKKNQPCLGSLAASGLCHNTFVPLFGTGVECPFPLPVPSGPPSFGPQGLLISWTDLREKTATEVNGNMYGASPKNDRIWKTLTTSHSKFHSGSGGPL